MKSTFESNFRIDFSNQPEEDLVLNHDFRRDILKIDTNVAKTEAVVEIKSFSENLYNDLLDKGIGSLENFEKLFHMQ